MLLCGELRTTIDIPDALFRQIKAEAAVEGETLRAFMLRAAQNELENPDRKITHSSPKVAEPEGGIYSPNREVTSKPLAQTKLSNWTLQKLEFEFDLERKTDHDLLSEWLDDPPLPNKKEAAELEALRQLMERKSVGWNEEELKFHFLGPLCRLVNFEDKDSNLFAGRPIKAVVADHEIGGVVDAMFASGRYDPVEPYFCFHEYKKESGNDSDPAAQVLAAMLAARELNGDGRPVYGAYVIGRTWFFLALEGTEQIYCYGPSFDAGGDSIVTIFGILRRMRDWGREWTREEKN